MLKDLLLQADQYKQKYLANAELPTNLNHLLSRQIATLYGTSLPLDTAIDYLLTLSQTPELKLSEAVLKDLHRHLYEQSNPDHAGCYRTTDNVIDTCRHPIPAAAEIEHFMEHFMSQLELSKPLMHPIEYAAIAHKRLDDIAPFSLGNRQIALLLLNLILLTEGYCVTILLPAENEAYKQAMQTARTQYDTQPLTGLIAQGILRQYMDSES